jgi:hypothetical protein
MVARATSTAKDQRWSSRAPPKETATAAKLVKEPHKPTVNHREFHLTWRELDAQPIKMHPQMFATKRPQDSPAMTPKAQRAPAPVTAAVNTAVTTRVVMA